MPGDTSTYSEAALRALGIFGLTTSDVQDHTSDHTRRAAEAACDLDTRLRSREIALIRGPSGSGKSTLLRALANTLTRRGQSPITLPDLTTFANRRVIDLFTDSGDSITKALQTLATAGLADAMIPSRRVQELSDGQRARLAIALAMRDAAHATANGYTATILIDELASTLDDTTGEALCITLAKWVRRTANIRLIIASPREHAATWLAPDIIIEAGGPQGYIHVPVPPVDAALSVNRCRHANSVITVSIGDLRDYHALSHLHYRDRKPATVVRVLVARLHPGRRAARATQANLIGVLVVSMPTLNGAWRALAWPGEYSSRGLPKREATSRINRDLRCISRVIVDPRYRARGIGAALVRAYLADPLTRRTEAIAAMGAACPIFTRAGMREWSGEPTTRDRRLIEALDRADICAWMIADIDATRQKIEHHAGLEKAFRVWAGKHGATRSLVHAPIEDIVQAAAKTIVTRPRAYSAGE
jgi:ABC-type lipoprotein export system ATPase subunit/GNAT superfamily N-acetyltransferase